MASRQAGNDTESGDVIVIIDAHIEVAEGRKLKLDLIITPDPKVQVHYCDFT